MASNNIVLIHGLWMTPLSFEYWAHHYSERGYGVFAPSWPGMERDIRALRRWLPISCSSARPQANKS